MRKVNIASPKFTYRSADPEGFRAGRYRVGKDVGAERSGTSVYELPPGQAICNETDETVRVLMYSEVVYPAVTVYPDSDKVGIWTANKDDDLLVKRSSGVGYFEGEPGT